MAAKKSSAPMDYIVSRLKRNPDVAYADVKEGAEAKGMTVHPIMYGRAKLLLGMVKPGSAKKKKKKKAKRATKKATRKAGRRGPGRPRKSGRRAGGAGGAVESIQALVREVEAQGRENTQLRATLEKVRDLIDRAL